MDARRKISTITFVAICTIEIFSMNFPNVALHYWISKEHDKKHF